MATSRLNWTLLDTTAGQLAGTLGLKSSRDAFPILVLSNVLNITTNEAIDADTDGANDRGVDAFHFDERDGQSRLSLFNFKYYDDFSKADATFPGSEVTKVVGFVDDIINLRADTIENTCHPPLPR